MRNRGRITRLVASAAVAVVAVGAGGVVTSSATEPTNPDLKYTDSLTVPQMQTPLIGGVCVEPDGQPPVCANLLDETVFQGGSLALSVVGDREAKADPKVLQLSCPAEAPLGRAFRVESGATDNYLQIQVVGNGGFAPLTQTVTLDRRNAQSQGANVKACFASRSPTS